MPLETSIFWTERIKSTKANNPKWGAKRIERQLLAEGERWGRTGVPSDRTVGRILKRVWEGLSEEERAPYRSFYWPESMERGDLPWEASESALELLSYFDSGGKLRARPPIRFVKWFWRVSQAGPGGDIAGRVASAVVLTLNELTGRLPVRGVEWRLAYRPWAGRNHRDSYIEAMCRAENPIPKLDLDVTVSGRGPEIEAENEAQLGDCIKWIFGSSLAESKAMYFWTLLLDDAEREIIRREVRENG